MIRCSNQIIKLKNMLYRIKQFKRHLNLRKINLLTDKPKISKDFKKVRKRDSFARMLTVEKVFLERVD
jgi:hypothetical protein